MKNKLHSIIGYELSIQIKVYIGGLKVTKQMKDVLNFNDVILIQTTTELALDITRYIRDLKIYPDGRAIVLISKNKKLKKAVCTLFTSCKKNNLFVILIPDIIISDSKITVAKQNQKLILSDKRLTYTKAMYANKKELCVL